MIRRLFLAVTLSLSVAWGQLALAEGSPRIETRSSSPSRLDTSKDPYARQMVLRVASGFPNLGPSFEVLDGTTGKRYNCIAHSLGIHTRWVNPKTGPAGNPLLYMDQMYRARGYTRVRGLDFRQVAGVRKVVVYATLSDGRIREVTHAAIQEADGTWTSKLGQLPLIRHLSPLAVAGGTYGQPVAVYVIRR
jgi:type VI secretion system secreted protein VgrG